MWSASPKPQEELCQLQFSYVATTPHEKQKNNICYPTWWLLQTKTFAGAPAFWTWGRATAMTKWTNCGEFSPGGFLAVTHWRAPNRWFQLWSQSLQGQDSNLGLGCKRLQVYVKWIRWEIGKTILHHSKSTSAVAWKTTQQQTIVFWWCSVEARWQKKHNVTVTCYKSMFGEHVESLKANC